MSKTLTKDILEQAARSLLQAKAGKAAHAKVHEKELASIMDKIVSAAALRIFKRADTDGNGSLSKAEFESALSFEALNRNMDGVIDQGEFLKA